MRDSNPPASSAVSAGMLELALVAVLFGTALLALATGPAPIGLREILQSLIPGQPADSAVVQTLVQLRLPRIVLGLLVGAALAGSGAAMQGIFRNPLVEPGLIGVSSGAAVAAVGLIVLGGRLANALPTPLLLPLASLAGAAAACWLVTRFARVDGRTDSTSLLLAGLAINAIAGGAIGLLSYLASDNALRTATYWMFGSLARAGWPELTVAAPLLLLALAALPRYARALNVLQLGETEAAYLGIDVGRVKRGLILWTLLAVGGSVALVGAIGFVGLIAPHLVRLLAGADHRRLMPASALAGASLLLLADLIARSVASPADLPIGILTALIGGPFFLVLLVRRRGDSRDPA